MFDANDISTRRFVCHTRLIAWGLTPKCFILVFFGLIPKLLINHEQPHNPVCIPFIQPGPEKQYSYRKKEFGGKH